jgi:prepilin-type processing-associated H-X9-DG protein
MKPRLSDQRETAMTLFEVGVVVAIVMILAALLLSIARPRRPHTGIFCVNNLKQIGLAYRIWEGDNGDIYPMGISVTNGGSMGLVQKGNAVATFQVMSNELSTPLILLCPEDVNRVLATNFASLSNSNVSYFVGVDVTNDVNPQLILSGDCNFEIGGKPAKSGLLSIWTNDPVTWSRARHGKSGYLLFADGSVQSVPTPSLRGYFERTGLATNRLAIP